LLITTAAPPMNDLVDDGVTGLAVPVRPENIAPLRRSCAYRITHEDLAATVERTLRLTLEERARMGIAARERFLADKARFEAAIGDVFGTIIGLELGEREAS